MSEDKDSIIRQYYSNTESGFGSINEHTMYYYD